MEVACAKRVSAYTLPTIPAICKCNFFFDKPVILNFLWHFAHQVTSKTFEQLTKSFNWPKIFFWRNVKEAVILIRTTQEIIFSQLNTMFSNHYRSFLQLIGCRKWLLHKTCTKVAWCIVALIVVTLRHNSSKPINNSWAG